MAARSGRTLQDSLILIPIKVCKEVWGIKLNHWHSLGFGSTIQGSASTGALKIKVWFEDDCIAIRVPSETTFAQLRDKLQDRLRVEGTLMIQYKDEPSGGYAELQSDNDLDVALQRNPKLQLYVGYS